MFPAWLTRWRRKEPDLVERCVACPLTAVTRGERASVVRMECAKEEAGRLRNLGLFEGSCITVLDRQDGCLLDVRGSRLALASKLADSITVLPIRS
jgi:Fe2+ transport system protein FeoA